MTILELAGFFKEREERVRRVYRHGQATPYEVQYWACMTTLAACRGELRLRSRSSRLRRLWPRPGSWAT
jgi:hypothetical protein